MASQPDVLHVQIYKARGIPPRLLTGPGEFYCLLECGDVVEATESEPGPVPEWLGDDVANFEIELEADRSEVCVLTLLNDGGTEGADKGDDDVEVAEAEISLVNFPAGVHTKKWYRMSGLTEPPAREIEVLLGIFLEVEGGARFEGMGGVSMSFLGEAGVAGAAAGLTPLMTAAIAGEVVGVRAALDDGHRADERSLGLGLNAVHFAARGGREDALAHILDRHPDLVSSKSGAGATPLHLAARKGHAGIVRLLVAMGARPGDKDAEGRTAMHEAADNGHAEAALALAAGNFAVAGMAGADGLGAIEAAAWGGHVGVARALLDPSSGGVPKGQVARAAESARRRGKQDMAALLAEHC